MRCQKLRVCGLWSRKPLSLLGSQCPLLYSQGFPHLCHLSWSKYVFCHPSRTSCSSFTCAASEALKNQEPSPGEVQALVQMRKGVPRGPRKGAKLEGGQGAVRLHGSLGTEPRPLSGHESGPWHQECGSSPVIQNCLYWDHSCSGGSCFFCPLGARQDQEQRPKGSKHLPEAVAYQCHCPAGAP